MHKKAEWVLPQRTTAKTLTKLTSKLMLAGVAFQIVGHIQLKK